MNTQRDDVIDLMNECRKYKTLAIALAIALADEASYLSNLDTDTSEKTIQILQKARNELPLKEIFDEINSLSFGALYTLLDND